MNFPCAIAVVSGRITKHFVNAKKPLSGLAVTLGLLFLCFPAHAQNNGRIFGAVTDQSGGAIVGAAISVVDVDRGITRPLITDSAGLFDAGSIIPGTYTVRAEAKGFKVAEHTAIDVGVGKEVRVDLTLQPGEQTQTITVTGDLPMVNTANAELGGTLEQLTVSELPVDGRNYQYLAWTRPGVVMSPGEGQNDFSTDGIRVQYVVWMIDGLIDSNMFVGSPSLVGGAQLGPDEATILPLDAIQEVNMVENATAVYGDKPGAHIDVGLKSGTNSFHGTAYAFGRDTVFNAKNPFLAQPAGSVQLPKAPLTLEQWGASIGGPIKKDKVFFFANEESQRFSVGVPKIQVEPTVASYGAAGPGTAGASPTFSTPDALYDILHSTNNTVGGGVPPSALSLGLAGCSALIPANGVQANPGGGYLTAAAVAGLKAMTPAQLVAGCAAGASPSVSIFGSGSTLPGGQIVTDFTTSGGSDNGIIKIDVHANDKNQFNFVWYSGGGNDITSAAEQYWGADLHTWANMGRAVWIWTPSSSWLNEFRFGYDYGNYPVFILECDKPNFSPPPPYASYGLVEGSRPCAPESSGAGHDVFGGYFEQTITGFAALGHQPAMAQDSFQHYFTILNNTSWTHGKHTVKFGPEIRLAYFNSAALVNDQGGVTFGGSIAAFTGASPLEDFLTGVATNGTILAGDPNRKTYVPSIGAYIQDDYRVLPRLTINAGIRYEYTWPWSNPGTNPGGIPAYSLGGFDPSLNTTTDLYQESKSKQVYNQYPLNFGPRLGIAWDVFGNGKTVVHAGGSVMFNSAPRGIQVLFSGGALINAVPTGFTFYDAAIPGGTAGPGNIQSTTLSLTGGVSPNVNNTAGSTGLPWTVGNPVFPGLSSSAFSCGDGFTKPTGGAAAGAKNVSPCQLQVVSPNFRVGYYITRSLSIQHAFTNNLTMDIAYVGTHGSNLDGLIDENPPSLGQSTTAFPAGGCTAATQNVEQCRRPFEGKLPFYAKILLDSNSELSNYDSLQASMTKRLSHGLQFTPGFTWSHELDLATVEDPHNPKLSWGQAGTPLVFTLTGTYYLPSKKSPAQLLEGWQVNTTVYMLSGSPTTATDSTDDLTGLGGSGSDRWNITGRGTDFKIGGPGLGIPCYGIVGSSFSKAANCATVNTPNAGSVTGSGMPAACLAAAAATPTNPNVPLSDKNATGLQALANFGCYISGNSVITPNAQGTLGNESTGELYGKPYRNWDFSATKNWKFKERYGLQFRVEFYNILNRTFYAGPALTLNTPSTFGKATATPDSGNPVIGNGPRKIQLGLKLSF